MMAGSLRRSACAAACGLLLVVGPERLFAQRGPASPPVVLQVSPDLGEVFVLELEQVIDVFAPQKSVAPAVPGSTRPLPPGPKGDIGPRRGSLPLQVTTIRFFARSVVEESDGSGSVLVSRTDSLLMASGPSGSVGAPMQMPVPESARIARIRVDKAGAMTLVDALPGATAVGATLSGMPAMLPDEAVAVGDSWVRDVPMPSLPVPSYRTDGSLRTRFQLDSLTRGGRDAWVSIEGTLRHDELRGELPPGSRVVVAGTISGYYRLDRRRGWITEARTRIDAQSEIVTSGDRRSPTSVAIRIQQSLNVR